MRENATEGTEILTIAAYDEDVTAGVINYYITNEESLPFDIDRNTGVLTANPNKGCDNCGLLYDEEDEWVMFVQASDRQSMLGLHRDGLRGDDGGIKFSKLPPRRQT